MQFRGLLRALAIGAFVVLVAACSGGTHSRGQFTGSVVGHSDEEIISKMGKPERVDETDPKRPRWVFTKKTFDPDNFNKVDDKATVILERKDGKLVGIDVIFG
jgi:hypothetical protein